jgi:arylsulfatase A-like enzyme
MRTAYSNRRRFLSLPVFVRSCLHVSHIPASITVTTLLLGVIAAMPARAAERPNFVILMTDDQRADAMSCAGNRILITPNMDRIAGEGIRFSNMFVTNSLCAPSRTTLLTGQYSHTHGVTTNHNKIIPPDKVLLPDLLREAGYAVAFCGKSHVDNALRDRKWDYYFGYQGQGQYLDPKIAEGVDGEDRVYEGYIDDVVTGKAIEWLKKRTDDRPFCMFLWFKAPHRAWIRARRHYDLYRGVTIPKPSTFDDDLKGYPGKPRAFVEATNKIGVDIDVRTLEGFVKDYYATLVAVDENVGRLFNALEDIKALDDTAILYTSDNGFFAGEWRAYDKRFMHEPSIRVPLLIRYPKLIRAGSLNDRMILNIDIAPTVLDLAGVEVPDWMQGRSVVPLLKGEPVEWRKDWLYEYFEYPERWHSVRKHRGVRTERYKYIHYYEEPQEYELYDLEKDPEERENLYGQPEYAELTEQLRQRLNELRAETHDR